MLDHARTIENAKKAFSSFPLADSPAGSLPLTDELADEYRSRKPFAGTDILFIQHHLAAFPGRLQAMIDCGMERERAWFVDIPYSTHPSVVAKLRDMGFLERQMTPRFDDPLAPYNAAQEERMRSLMESLESRDDPRRLLVVDDGAYFARYLNRLKEHDRDRLRAYRGAAVVEQTTRGHRYLCNEALEVIMLCSLSAVSIARCRTKKEFEGPFVGKAQARSMVDGIGEDGISGAGRVGMIGCGVVGKATLDALLEVNPDLRVDVVDIDASVRAGVTSTRRNAQGVPQLKEDCEYDIVVGCTGYNSFHLDQRSLLADGAVLASGSSAAIEFNRAGFIELADEFDDDEIEVLDRDETVARGIHSPIRLRQERGRTFTFLNAGFPVNFDGGIEGLPQRIIQATHGLLFSAGIQALAQAAPGINAIDPAEDGRILDMAVSLLAAES